ncbi:hypothetical protein [Noviherbaspirillum massiliense]|uniref:hypothetical protein n=1 Tax=Noviherbaspirillum massiliense TaxID=1465823 RepID=UPI00030E289D|nr:hypothetical protein [Noviherbaspirillum massiliense]
MKPFSGNAPLAWVAALGALMAVLWPYFSASPLPLPGLRNLSAPLIGWPLAAVSFAMAAWLSLPAWQSRDRLLICAGFSLCLCFVVALYASMVAACIFAFIGKNIIYEQRRT